MLCVILHTQGKVDFLPEWREKMAVSYNKLWKILIDKGMTKTQMRKESGISTNVLAKMGKGETISMESLGKIAAALDCGLDDIVELLPDPKTRKKQNSNENK